MFTQYEYNIKFDDAKEKEKKAERKIEVAKNKGQD